MFQVTTFSQPIYNTLDYSTVCESEYLVKEGFTHILNCNSVMCGNLFPNKFEYLSLSIQDDPTFVLFLYFYRAIEFISSVVDGGKIVIHCSQGVSRAPALLASYLIWKYGYSVDNTIRLIQKRRKVVDPNIGFIMQLKEWEIHLRNISATPEAFIYTDQLLQMSTNFTSDIYKSPSSILFIFPSFCLIWQGKESQNTNAQLCGQLMLMVQKYANGPLQAFYLKEE